MNNNQKLFIFISSMIISVGSVLILFFILFYPPTKINLSDKPKSDFNKISLVKKEVTPPLKEVSRPSTEIINNTSKLPILLYHKTPSDFEEQMKILISRGYTAVTMNEATSIISGESKGPTKPIAITFDDGFTDQLNALNILKKYNLKATFYIIVGGKESNYCIGAEKKYANCGDAYLNWQDIKSILASGIIEIGSHTIDHLQLTGLNEESQKYQIFESKKILEDKLGVKINSFAYPYGKYSDISKKLVLQAGYTNATTVNAAYTQDSSKLFELYRIRKTNDLP